MEKIARETFKQVFTELVGAKLHVERTQISKLDGIHDALSAVPSADAVCAMPVLDLDAVYERYCKSQTVTIPELVESAVAELQKTPELSTNWITDWAKAKDRLILSVCNVDRQGYLANLVYETVGEIALVPKILLPSASCPSEDCYASAPVNRRLLDVYGISKEELMQQTKESAMKLLPYYLTTMEDVLANIGMPGGLIAPTPGKDEGNRLYILTTRQKWNGAATLFYPGMMEQLHEQFGDYFIIPSSVHEVILKKKMPDDKKGFVSSMCEIIMDINEAEVAPEERLSDVLYTYDAYGFHRA